MFSKKALAATSSSPMQGNARVSGASRARGSGFAYPVTLTAIKTWARSLPQCGVQRAPASAVMSKR